MPVLNPPFDDSKKPAAAKATRNPSTSTTDTDAFRQGVSLTLPLHYARGMVKIYGGYHGQTGDHTVPQLIIGAGQKKMLDENYVADVLPMDPKSVVGNKVVESSVVLVNKDGDPEVDAFVNDGVIEPLTVRRILTKQETRRKAVHRIWGALDEGNVVDRERTERFFVISKQSDLTFGSYPFSDNSRTMGLTPSGSVKLSETILSVDGRAKSPFADDQNAKGVILSANMDGPTTVALNACSPPTDNLQAYNYVQVGGTGFEYGR